MLTEKQVPYTGPYGLRKTVKIKNRGPTAEALKRAMGHLEFMPWRDYNNIYNKDLGDAMSKWKVSVGLRANPGYAEKTWTKLRNETFRDNKGVKRYALDPYARWLIQKEAGAENESENEEKVQRALKEWGYAIIRNQNNISYSQNRPIDVSKDPTSTFASDCSGTVIQGYHYARTKTGLDVPDPAKMDYSGYGNTDLYEDDHPKVAPPYRIGDLAHFVDERHVIMCIFPGTVANAEWVSHGWDAGPDLVKLLDYNRYPGEYLFTVRPPLIKED